MCILDYPSIENYPVYEPLKTGDEHLLSIVDELFVNSFNLEVFKTLPIDSEFVSEKQD